MICLTEVCYALYCTITTIFRYDHVKTKKKHIEDTKVSVHFTKTSCRKMRFKRDIRF